jgi:3-methyladenine DNA glycosylase AlkD
MMILEEQKTLRDLGNPVYAEHALRFFKTGKGEYGEGDQFLGIRVPVLRKHAKAFQHLSLKETTQLLHSNFHEERLCALFILIQKFNRGSPSEQEQIYELYLDNTQYINGWDLVDSSAHQIVGKHLFNPDRSILYDLVKSESLWERRIAIISTHHFIREHQYSDTLKISEQLLDDGEDLIHKAVGWMLREVGNRDLAVEESFLKRHYKSMPRTMLRYAIEKFPEEKRKRYLKGLV